MGRKVGAPTFGRVWATIVVLVGLGLAYLTPLRTVGFSVVLGMLLFVGWRLGYAVVRPRSMIDHALVTWTFAHAVLLTLAQLLSLGGLFGTASAWLTALAASSVATIWLLPGDTRLPELPGWQRTMGGMGWPGIGLSAAFGLILLTDLVCTLFAAPNVGDALTVYVPSAVRYLQDGSLYSFSTSLNYYPYGYPVVIGFPLLFLESDALVCLTSFVTAGLACLGVYQLSRRVGWSGPLSLAAAALPFTMPQFITQASSSRHDVIIAQWIVFAVYFLRRGFPGSHLRWLIPAALATALALTIKATFWLAAPGLLLLWGLVLLRMAWRRGPRRMLRCSAVCLVLIVVVGAPFLVRNRLMLGFYVTEPSYQDGHTGELVSAQTLSRRLVFSTLVAGFVAATPPFLLPADTHRRAARRAMLALESLGFFLPDESLMVPADRRWDVLHLHVRWPYLNDFAAFGSSSLLVVVPGLAALPIVGRRLGARRLYLYAIVVCALSFMVFTFTLLKYNSTNVRYAHATVLLLCIAAPSVGLLVPRRARTALLLLVGLVALAEMVTAFRLNTMAPAAQLMSVPRDEQYFRFYPDPTRLPTMEAARALQSRYPVDAYPELFIAIEVEGGIVPATHQYAFMRPLLTRRTHEWIVRPDATQVPLPLILQDRALVDRLTATGGVVADQLSATTWILLPAP